VKLKRPKKVFGQVRTTLLAKEFERRCVLVLFNIE